jgi:hypothetical protein
MHCGEVVFRREPTASGAGGGRPRVRRMSTGASYCLRQGAGGIFARVKAVVGLKGRLAKRHVAREMSRANGPKGQRLPESGRLLRQWHEACAVAME